MKKFTLFLMSMFLFLGTAMAQNTLDLTFTKVSASEATVNVAGNGIDANGITADVKANVDWKTLTADSETFPNASMLCPDRNTSLMTAGNEGVFTITLNNVPEGYSFKNVTFTSAALNGGGAFQGDNANAQPVNFTLKQGETVLGTAENVLIKVNSAGGEFVTVPFEVAEAYTATEGTLELTLTLSVTESKGCFYGLTKISIETEAATVEPEPEVETFAVTADLNPVVEGDITEIKCIHVQHNEGASISDFPTEWTLTNETGESFTLSYEWGLNNWDDILVYVNPAITEAGTYTLTIPAGSLTTEGGKECAAAEFSWTIVATVEPEPEPAATQYRVKTDAGYLNIGNTDEHATGPVGGVNVVAYAEDNNQIFTLEDAGDGNYYLKSASGYYVFCQQWNVDGLTEKMTALTFEKIDETSFYIKHAGGYFKVEEVSGTYYPFCDAAVSSAATWTLEEVAVVEPEPETPFEVVAVTPAEAVAELSTITVEFSEEIAGTQDVMAMETIYVGSRSNACNFTVEGKVLTITLWTPITTPGEYALKVPASVGITRVSNGEAVTIDGEITFTVEEPAAPFEVVAVTPAEAVAELSTITVEFSEEIAGTQDVMAMETIYVGSRSNACNFTVEGKVLTITLWTPITTPGEYALKVPASVGITRVSNGEAVTIDGEITFTVEEAVVEPEPENLVKIYHITAKDTARGALYASAEEGYLSHCGATYPNYHHKDIAADATDPAQQFAFVEYEGATYLYAIGAQRFAVKDGTYIKLAEGPDGIVTVVDSDVEGYKNILLNGENKLNFSGGYTYGTVANWEYADDGNRLLLTETGDFDATELLASMEAYFVAKEEALAAARAEFDAAYAEAKAILDEAAITVAENEVALQTTDNAASYYLWCNVPDPEEGSINALVDNVTDNGEFFHSSWHTSVTADMHYLEVDLGEGNELTEFSFGYHTRVFAGGNDFPDGIQIMGSNDGENYTEVANITSGLPQAGDKYWRSNIISSETAYRYFRFNITAERTYWHMSEFDIVTTDITINEKYAAVANAVAALDKVYNENAENADYTTEQLIAATEDIYAALVEIFKDDNTVALIEAAYELLDIEGVGYPAAAPREALEEAIEIAEEMPDTEAGTALQAAIDAYYATTDVVLPEGGKAYTLTMVAKNGNKFYLNYTGSDIAMVARTTDEELPNSAKFVAEDNGDGTVSLKTIDGKYLVYHSKYAGVDWLQDGGDTDGLQEAKDAMTNITFAKMVNGNQVKADSNEQIFGMLTWYGKRGFDTGKNNDCYGYMVLKADGSDYDGAADAFWNDGYSSAFIVEETVIPVEPLKVVAVTPAEEVTSLREITIEFDAEIAVAELTGTDRISIDYGWGVLIGTTATAEGNVLTLVTDTEIKDAGTYPLTIPAGVVTRVSDGVAYEGGTFEFTVVKEDVVVEPLTVVAVTPAEAVEAIETITIEFSDNVNVPATASGQFTIADAEGNVVATFAAWDAAVEGKVVTLTLTEAITTAGEYTFSFAEGLVTRQGDNATCAYSCTITVTFAEGIDGIIGEAGDATIYDLTGRKVEKINGSGIYIVNGKKVFVK